MIYSLLRSLLFRVDPETVHEWVLQLTQPLGWLGLTPPSQQPLEVGGVRFPNRVGLAAGFDKNGRWIGVAQALGFGHVEVGAITPRPQAGHPRPRLFRLPQHQAIRNRMGFNNDGLQVIAERLRAAQRGRSIVVGVNLGKNADTPLEEAYRDYQAVMDGCADWVDYFTLNVSSPNTEGLRRLSQVEALGELLSRLQPRRPLWLKLSPDEPDANYSEIARQAPAWGLAGVVACNTTMRRDPPLDQVDPLGGISGRPVFATSLARVQALHQANPDLPLMGVGGVFGLSEARQYRQAGAQLVQIYTGMIYQGPGMVRKLAKELR